jgi:hypothetical protein
MMKRSCCHLWRCLLIAPVMLLLCGCGGDDQGPLFQDDFENSGSGWKADQRDEFDRGYKGGEYFFELHESDWLAWARPGKKFDDVSVEVDARVASGAQDGHFGILCRYRDADNFYYFAVSADGYYAIFRRAEGDMKVLTANGKGMLFSSSIKTDRQVNRVAAVCRGDELSLYANGQWLATVTDDTHANGDVGIGAGSGPEGITRVLFDNFVVTAP